MSTQEVQYTPPEVAPTPAVSHPAHGRTMRWQLALPVVSLIWVVGMIDKIGVGVVAANGPFLAAVHLQGKSAEIGFLTTFMLMFYGASMPVWGWFVDKVGPRRCAVTGLVFWAIATAVCGVSDSYGTLLVGRALLGVSQGFLWPLSNVLTARWFPRSERSRAKTVWLGGINLGFALSGYVINDAISVTNWRGSFFLLTILAGGICLPAAWFFMKDDPAGSASVSQDELALITADTATEELTGSRRRAEMLTWPYWVVVLQWTVNNMGVFGLAAWFPTYLAQHNVGPSEANNYIALAFAMCIVVSPLIAIGMDRTGRKSIFTLLGFAIGAVALLFAKLDASSGFEIAMVIIAIIGIEGITTLTGQAVLHDMAPSRRMGRAAGLMSGVANFAGAFGATIMGALISTGGFTLAFTFLIGVFVIGGCCAVALHRARF